MPEHAWAHDELAADLMDARHCLGEIAIERLGVRGGQLDVASMRLSWSRPQITGYEVKVSRADFYADIRQHKWRNYLPCVGRLYFAVPAGLINASEVPEEAGLLYRSGKGWYSVRRPARRDTDPLYQIGFLKALLFRHYPASWQLGRLTGADLVAKHSNTNGVHHEPPQNEGAGRSLVHSGQPEPGEGRAGEG